MDVNEALAEMQRSVASANSPYGDEDPEVLRLRQERADLIDRLFAQRDYGEAQAPNPYPDPVRPLVVGFQVGMPATIGGSIAGIGAPLRWLDSALKEDNEEPGFLTSLAKVIESGGNWVSMHPWASQEAVNRLRDTVAYPIIDDDGQPIWSPKAWLTNKENEFDAHRRLWEATRSMAGNIGQGLLPTMATVGLTGAAGGLAGLGKFGQTALAIGSMSTLMADQEYRDLRREGVDEDVAAAAASKYGALTGPVEYAQAILGSGIYKYAAATKGAGAAFNYAAERALARFNRSMGAPLVGEAIEGAEEVVQGAISNPVKDWAYANMRAKHGEQWQPTDPDSYTLNDAYNDFAVGAVGGGFLRAAGKMIGMVRSGRKTAELQTQGVDTANQPLRQDQRDVINAPQATAGNARPASEASRDLVAGIRAIETGDRSGLPDISDITSDDYWFAVALYNEDQAAGLKFWSDRMNQHFFDDTSIKKDDNDAITKGTAARAAAIAVDDSRAQAFLSDSSAMDRPVTKAPLVAITYDKANVVERPIEFGKIDDDDALAVHLGLPNRTNGKRLPAEMEAIRALRAELKVLQAVAPKSKVSQLLFSIVSMSPEQAKRQGIDAQKALGPDGKVTTRLRSVVTISDPESATIRLPRGFTLKDIRQAVAQVLITENKAMGASSDWNARVARANQVVDGWWSRVKSEVKQAAMLVPEVKDDALSDPAKGTAALAAQANVLLGKAQAGQVTDMMPKLQAAMQQLQAGGLDSTALRSLAGHLDVMATAIPETSEATKARRLYAAMAKKNRAAVVAGMIARPDTVPASAAMTADEAKELEDQLKVTVEGVNAPVMDAFAERLFAPWRDTVTAKPQAETQEQLTARIAAEREAQTSKESEERRVQEDAKRLTDAMQGVAVEEKRYQEAGNMTVTPEQGSKPIELMTPEEWLGIKHEIIPSGTREVPSFNRRTKVIRTYGTGIAPRHEMGHAVTDDISDRWDIGDKWNARAKGDFGKWDNKWKTTAFIPTVNRDHADPRNYDWSELSAYLVGDYLAGDLDGLPYLKGFVRTVARQNPKSTLAKALTHVDSIRSAAYALKPFISSAAIDTYGIKLPDGYVREGDRYVFKNERSPDARYQSAPLPPITPAELDRRIAEVARQMGGSLATLRDGTKVLRLGAYEIAIDKVSELRNEEGEPQAGVNIRLRDTSMGGKIVGYRILLSDDANATTAAHEVVHAAMDMLEADERRVLAAEFGRTDMNVEVDEAVTQEIAEAIATGRQFGTAGSRVRIVWNRIKKLLNAMFTLKFGEAWQAVKGLPNELKADGIKAMLATGEVFDRGGTQRQGTPEEREMLAGRRAATANVGNSDRAEAMERELLKPDMTTAEKEAVWDKIAKETGWHRVVEGEKMMFEVDDSKMRLVLKYVSRALAGSDVALGDLLTGPANYVAIFEAYPQLKDVVVRIKTGLPSASYNSGDNSITIRTALGGEGKNILPDLAHEIQHAIQEIEGFKQGTSPNAAAMEAMMEQDAFDPNARVPDGQDLYNRSTGEALARVSARRLDMTPDQRAAESPRETLKKMLREEGLLREGQSPEDVLIHRGGEGADIRYQPARRELDRELGIGGRRKSAAVSAGRMLLDYQDKFNAAVEQLRTATQHLADVKQRLADVKQQLADAKQENKDIRVDEKAIIAAERAITRLIVTANRAKVTDDNAPEIGELATRMDAAVKSLVDPKNKQVQLEADTILNVLHGMGVNVDQGSKTWAYVDSMSREQLTVLAKGVRRGLNKVLYGKFRKDAYDAMSLVKKSAAAGWASDAFAKQANDLIAEVKENRFNRDWRDWQRIQNNAHDLVNENEMLVRDMADAEKKAKQDYSKTLAAELDKADPRVKQPWHRLLIDFLASPKSAFERMSPAAMDTFYKRIREAKGMADTVWRTGHESFKKAVADAGWNTEKELRDAAAKTRIFNIAGKQVEMTGWQAVDRLSSVTDPDSLNAMMRGRPVYFEKDQGVAPFSQSVTDLFRPQTPDGKIEWINIDTGERRMALDAPSDDWYSPDIKAAIKEFIAQTTPTERKIASESKVAMRPVLEAFNEYWRRTHHGKDKFREEWMPHTDAEASRAWGLPADTQWGYSPRFSDTKIGEKTFRDGSELILFNLEETGVSKSRTSATDRAMLIRNYSDAYNERLSQLTRMAFLQEPVRQAVNLVQDTMQAGKEGFASKLVETYGEQAKEDVMIYLQRAAGFAHHAIEMPGWSALARNTMIGRLAFRPTTWMANRWGSVPTMRTSLNTIQPGLGDEFAKQAATYMSRSTPENAAALKALMYDKDTGYFYRRWNQDMFRAYSQTDLSNPSQVTEWNVAMAELQNYAMSMFANAEQSVAIAAYKACIAKGMSASQAVATVEDIFRSNQNPSDSLDESAALRRVKMSNWGWLFPFIGQTMAIRNLLADSAMALTGDNVDAKKVAQARSMVIAIAMTMLASEAFRAIMRKFIRGPDEDEEEKRNKKIAMNLMRDALGTVAPGIGDNVAAIMSGQFTDGGMFAQGLQDALAAPALGVRALTSDDASPDIEAKQVVDAIRKTLIASATMSGVPASGGVDQLSQFLMERIVPPTKEEVTKRRNVAVMDSMGSAPNKADFNRTLKMAYKDAIADDEIDPDEVSFSEFRNRFKARVLRKFGKAEAERLGYRIEDKKKEERKEG